MGYSVGLEFSLNADGVSYSVIGIGECTDEDLIIPGEYNGLPVTVIGVEAFNDCDTLKSVTIPDSIIEIKPGAFSWCNYLEFVNISQDSLLEVIGSSVFINCKITSMYIPAKVISIGLDEYGMFRSPFAYCKLLTSITVDERNTKYYSVGNCIIDPETKTLVCGINNSVIPGDGSVTQIGVYAFYACNVMESIIIPDAITVIADSAFSACSSLVSAVIPDSVTDIGQSAFFLCSSLESIVIPRSVTYIGGNLFGSCDMLTSVIVEEGNPVYHSNGNCIIETATKTLISGCNNSTIPTDGSVEIIGNFVFNYCDVLENIVIPGVITRIGSCAYYRCNNLTSVVIEQGVARIEWNAFANCQSLVSVIIPDSVTSIDEYAFEGCSSLTNIYYTGTEEEWTKLGISDNPYLANATIIYNYVPEE